ncbi:MAG: D-2-hydroxyacid dehydrogenase [Vicinamibacterales bacterium]
MSVVMINVVVSLDCSDDLMNQIRAVSPRLHVERHFPTVPDSAWANAEVLYTGHPLPEPSQAPRLRWVQFNSAGIDHVASQPFMKVEGIEITTASGIHATHMAEFCLMMMLALTYKLPRLLELQARAEWGHPQPELTSQHAWPLPRELRGQTLGIAGYGSIGRELARIAHQMGMRVLASKQDVTNLCDEDYSEPGTGDPNADIPDRIYPAQALASMARECDFLVLILPLAGGTRHIVDETVLNAMKPTAVLVNVGRGGTVDEDALINALAAQKIAGAALDVFEAEPLPSGSPLWNMDNVMISPHVAGRNVRYSEKAAALFIANLKRYLDNRPLLNRVKRDRGY